MGFKKIVDGGIRAPSAITCNHSTKELFIYDSANSKITFLTDSGRFLIQLSTKLKTDAVPPECKSLAYSNNELYMLDSPNNSIKVFARGRHWAYFRSIIPRGMDEMRGLSISPDQNLYISNCWTHSILKVDKSTGETSILADRDTELDFPKFFRFFNDRLIVTEEFACSVKIFIVEESSEDNLLLNVESMLADIRNALPVDEVKNRNNSNQSSINPEEKTRPLTPIESKPPQTPTLSHKEPK